MSDYPARMTLRPISSWPGVETRSRERSQFSAPWSATLELLDRELFYLGPGRQYPPSVLQVALRERDFRIDGMPRANAIPSHPGVIVNIQSTKGPLSFPCDKFDRWKDNLRAIALGLEALRKVERYGITPGDEQYQGWKALPREAAAPAFTADAAEAFLREVAAEQGEGLDIGTLQQAYRRAVFTTHPDRNDGDRTRFDLVEAAAAVLRNSGRLA
ncbi:MAG: molecular chaperone DnaJ [Mycolicibacterium frederiksbergense]|nr:molecular chaperone DnaJ [Mycolicibacterium frederiksbergense]